MSQQINLFNPLFQKQKKYFSAMTMVHSAGVVAAAGLLLSLYATYQTRTYKEIAETVTAKRLVTQRQLETVTAALKPQKNDGVVDANIKKTMDDIQGMQQLLNAVQQGDFGNTSGYSDYFKSFSHQIVPGIWLTEISINGVGRDIDIKGKALNAALVPQFLLRMKQEPDLAGKSFSRLLIQAPSESSREAGASAARDTAAASAASGSGRQAGYVTFELKARTPEDSDKTAVSQTGQSR